jgi:hypothetical protein
MTTNITREALRGVAPVTLWDYNDFREMWENLRDAFGEEQAWQTIFELWQVRAGEVF